MSSTYIIDGPPGTGKTTWLAQQARNASDAHGAQHVAIASLTKTAAAEIAGRDHDIPPENVGTLHAHAYRALDRPDLAETPEGLADWNTQHPADQLSGGPRRLDDAPTPDGDDGRTHTDQLHAQVAALRARRTPPSAWSQEQRAHHERWTDYKTQTGRLDFTDLIEHALHHQPIHPASPQVLLLDEAQDFSLLELNLALSWARHTQTTVIVGDPRQALYAWRGSDPDILTQLAATDRRTLHQSHRVPAAVHALAQQWIAQLAIGPAHYQPTSQPGHATTSQHSLRELAAVLEQTPSDATTMILTACGYMLAPVLAELRRQAIPYHNPYRAAQGQWNPMRAAGRLLAYLRPDRATWGEQARPWTWDDVRMWTEPLKARGVLAHGAKTFIEARCRKDQFGISQASQTAPQETLAQLLIWPDGCSEHPAFRMDTTWWQDHLRASTAKAQQYPLHIHRTRGPAALRQPPRVIVGTIHSVKGGQADHVIVSPDLSKQGYWHGWRQGGQGRDSIVRMMYVALTRARQSATILAPSITEHIPMDLLRQQTQTQAAA